MNVTEYTVNEQAQQRHQQLESWLQQCFSDYTLEIFSLPGDASFRRYHRLTLTANDPSDETADDANQLHYIVMDAPPEKESITEFVKVDELLSDYINVPTIIAKDMQQGFLVLQDFGTTEFAHLVADTTLDTVDSYYKQAIATLIQLQQVDIDLAKSQAGLPDYDDAMLTREMDLFSEWFLPYISVALDAQSQKIWQSLKQAIIAQVLTQAPVVVHRDYHSRNLMQDQADTKRLGVIDFQDAVIGAYSYDLVSLLRDAYVHWPEEQIALWIEHYRQALINADNANTESYLTHLTLDQLTEDFNIMGVQRHLKILGIFVRLSERDGKTRYLADIPKVMQDLIIELDWLAQYGSSAIKQPIIAFKVWLDEEVIPAYHKRFELS